VPFFFKWPNFESVKLVGVYLTQFGRIKRNQNGMKLGQFHYYPSSVRKRRRKLLSDELLLVLAVGLTVGALGLWLILRAAH
jgi:hypothetical protein